MNTKALILLLLLTTTFTLFGASYDTTGEVIGDGAGNFWFVGQVTKIVQDPIEGVWAIFAVGEHTVMVWYPKATLEVDDYVLVIGFYLGDMVYPLEGEVSVFIGWYAEVLEAVGYESD